MFKVPVRVYRTDDGRLVTHGDPAAAYLAYPAGTELSDEEATRFGLPDLFGQKRAQAPQNKLGRRPADKSATPREGTE